MSLAHASLYELSTPFERIFPIPEIIHGRILATLDFMDTESRQCLIALNHSTYPYSPLTLVLSRGPNERDLDDFQGVDYQAGAIVAKVAIRTQAEALGINRRCLTAVSSELFELMCGGVSFDTKSNHDSDLPLSAKIFSSERNGLEDMETLLQGSYSGSEKSLLAHSNVAGMGVVDLLVAYDILFKNIARN